jgi:hypothetical protein
MINFRYHIVSLVAVFLALGLGILMGSTVIDQGLVRQLQKQTKSLGGNLDTVRDENGNLRSQLALWESFGQDSLAPFTSGRLRGRHVLLVGQDGADPHVFDQIADALRDAGATTSGRMTFSPKWSLKDDAARAQLAVALGVRAARAEEMWSEAAGRLAGRLGRARDRTEAGDLLATLQTAGFLSIDAASPGAFPPAGAMVILVGSGVKDASPPEAEFFVPFLRALNPARRTLVAEPLNSADSIVERVRGDADLREKVSTIDDTDITLGRVALVLSLRELAANGRATHFGSRRSASGLLPASFLR